MQLQINFQTLKPPNGLENMSQSQDANHNSYQVQNVNANLLRSQFTHQTPVMDPLDGLQSRIQGYNLNDNQFRTQNTLQASDANTTNCFLSDYLAPNVSRPNGNWDMELRTLLGLLVWILIIIRSRILKKDFVMMSMLIYLRKKMDVDLSIYSYNSTGFDSTKQDDLSLWFLYLVTVCL